MIQFNKVTMIHIKHEISLFSYKKERRKYITYIYLPPEQISTHLIHI